MIGMVTYTAGDASQHRLVLGDDGVWSGGDGSLADHCNLLHSPAEDSSPADGAYGLLQLSQVAELVRGSVVLPDDAGDEDDGPDMVY